LFGITIPEVPTVTVEGIATIRYLTTTSFGFGAS
jgi:hypothetical protein